MLCFIYNCEAIAANTMQRLYNRPMHSTLNFQFHDMIQDFFTHRRSVKSSAFFYALNVQGINILTSEIFECAVFIPICIGR